MNTKSFLILYYALIIVCSLFAGLRPPDYDTIGFVVFALILVIISLIPHIIGMMLAYKYTLIKAWMVLVCYWFCAMLVGLLPYGALMTPQSLLWAELRNFTDLSIYYMAVYCARTYFISSLLFLFFLLLIKKKNQDYSAKTENRNAQQLLLKHLDRD